MTGILLSESTAGKLRGLLREGTDSPVIRRRTGSSSLRQTVLVRCDSVTAAYGSGVGSQCYAGTIVDLGALDTSIEEGAEVWLTILGLNALPKVPQLGRIYECILLGELEITGTTKPRAVGTPGDLDADLAVVGNVNLTGQILGTGAKIFNRAVVVNSACVDTSGGGGFTGLIGAFAVLDSHSTFGASSGAVEHPVFFIFTDPSDTDPRFRSASFFSTSDEAKKDKSRLTVYGKLAVERAVTAPSIAVYDGSVTPSGVNGWVAAAYGFRVGNSTGSAGITEADASAGIVHRGGIITAIQGATGDILYFDGTRYRRLAIGSASNVLTVSGGLPAWTSPASAPVNSGASTNMSGVVRGDTGSLSGAELSGDVTTSGSNATTIANNAITTAKISNSQVTEAKLLLADNTTANASTSMHGYLKKLSNNATEFMDGQGNWSVPGGGAAGKPAGGRLTLSSSLAVPDTDLTISTNQSIYYLPFTSGDIALYDGADWNVLTFSSVSTDLGSTTSQVPFDIWAYDNAGAVSLDYTAWSNNSTRATSLALQDGVLVKSGTPTRRYLGTVKVLYDGFSSYVVYDTRSYRNVWNYYNQVKRHILKASPSGSWTYNSTTWRSWNATSGNSVNFMVGYGVSTVSMLISQNTNATADPMVAFGNNSNTVASWDTVWSGNQVGIGAAQEWVAPLGYNTCYMMERCQAAGTCTFNGFAARTLTGDIHC